MADQRLDSLILAADLSYLERNRTGMLEVEVSIAAMNS
jgi:hypothetical protein